MFCPKCGKELPAGARFCGGCGHQLTVQSAPAQAAPSADKNFATQSSQSQPAQQAHVQFAQASAKVAGGISDLQSKLDNSNSTILKGRSFWDLVGLGAVVLILICFFLPEVQGVELPQGMMNFSFSSLMAYMGSYSQSARFSNVLLIFLLPAALAAIDLLVIRENSSRHIRLIIWGVVSIAFQMPISSLIDLAKTYSYSSVATVSLGAGYYLWIFASLVLIVVGIVGVVQRFNSKSAA